MSSPPAPGTSTGKRRRTPPAEPGSRWASLHKDLVDLVASRLLAGDLLDYVRFRAVCTAWRSGTASPLGRGIADPRFHPRRWMMFPEGHPGRPELHGYVRFLNLDTGAWVRVNVPLLGDHCAFESVDGLLLLLLRNPYQDLDGIVRLLNPFTGDVAQLPPLGPLIQQLGLRSNPEPYRRFTRGACASVSFSKSGVMAIMLALRGIIYRVAYATSQDRQWTLTSWKCPIGYWPLSFQGKIYIMDTPSPNPYGENTHQIFEIHPPVQDEVGAGHQVQPPNLIATIPTHRLVYADGLVQCGSEILVLGHNEISAPQILVCKLTDLVLQRFNPIKNIGGNTLFLHERNISVSSRILPTVKGDNAIYIRSGRPHLVQYNLSSGTLLPAIDNCSLYGHAAGPDSLVLHIFSCCICDLWSRGLMYRRVVEFFGEEDEQDMLSDEEENNTWPPLVNFAACRD